MTLFQSDSRAIETTVGWIIALEGIWCWVADWFSTIYYYPRLAGYEWVVAVAGIGYAAFNYRVSHSENYGFRACMVMVSASALSIICVTLIQNLGWRVGGVPASLFGVAVMAWCYIKLKALHHVGKNRH